MTYWSYRITCHEKQSAFEIRDIKDLMLSWLCSGKPVIPARRSLKQQRVQVRG